MAGSSPSLESRFIGCLVGCAVGDALGAPFEGYWGHQLPGREALLEGFAEFEGYPRGQYTDDTQLTIATVESIARRGVPVPADIARSIAALWKTQSVVGPGGAFTFAAHAFLESRDWETFVVPTVLAALWALFRHPSSWPEAVAEAILLGGMSIPSGPSSVR